MFFIHYSIVVETKNEEGETVSEVQNKVIHIRTKETYENLLNQIEDNEDNEKIELLDHGTITAIDPIPKPDPFVCTKCKMREEVNKEFPFVEVQEPAEIKHEKIILADSSNMTAKNNKATKATKAIKTEKVKVEKADPNAPQFSDTVKAKPKKETKPTEKVEKPKKETKPTEKVEKPKKEKKPVLKKPLN
jgi:hypothetical protein